METLLTIMSIMMDGSGPKQSKKEKKNVFGPHI